MAGKLPPYMKSTRAKGREYYYFDTGQTDARGKKVWTRICAPSTRGFGEEYSKKLGHRTRRSQAPGFLTVTGLVNLYEAGQHFKSRAAATQRLYSRYLQTLVDNIGPDCPAAGLERKDVALLLDKMADRPGAANMVLAATGALYAWGRKRGHVESDPTRDLDPFDLGEHEPWDEGLLAKALAAKDDRVRLCTHLLYYTAQRIGDVARIRWSDIRDGRIHVRQQKTGATLEIPLHEDLAAELAHHPKSLTTIIPGVAGRPLSIISIRLSLQAFADARGHKIVPHGLRKNAVIALLESGCSAAETAAISGQSLAMVEHYAKRRAQGKLALAAVQKWQGNK